MGLVPCLGGWCESRDRCAHYHSEALMAPAERLCEPGQSEPVYFRQVPAFEPPTRLVEVLH